MKCIVCRGLNFEKKFTKNKYQLIKCQNCSLLAVQNLPTSEELAAFYLDRSYAGNYAYEKNKELLKVDEWLAKIIMGYEVDKKCVFDVGCYNGQLLNILKNNGWETWGLEFQESAAQRAKKNHGDKIFTGSIERFVPANLESRFDVITAMGLIEHTINPDVLVDKIGIMLKDGGYIFIQTPNYQSIVAQLMGKFWPPIAPPEHLYYFNSTNLSILFSRIGVKMIQCIPHWKTLRLGYVLDQLNFFGEEIAIITNKLRKIIPSGVENISLPFYGGEMLWIGKK